jgi:hypothetical protein
VTGRGAAGRAGGVVLGAFALPADDVAVTGDDGIVGMDAAGVALEDTTGLKGDDIVMGTAVVGTETGAAALVGTGAIGVATVGAGAGTSTGAATGAGAVPSMGGGATGDVGATTATGTGTGATGAVAAIGGVAGSAAGTGTGAATGSGSAGTGGIAAGSGADATGAAVGAGTGGAAVPAGSAGQPHSSRNSGSKRRESHSDAGKAPLLPKTSKSEHGMAVNPPASAASSGGISITALGLPTINPGGQSGHPL